MINYIIASYPGTERNKEMKGYSLILQTLVLEKCDLSLVSQITIVRTKPKGDFYPHYYNVKSSINNVPVVFLEYEGENKHHSYDQYLQAYLKYPNFSYYIFMEDDYCTMNKDFDKILVEMYKEKFKNNIGYLCNYATDKLFKIGYHVSISNGIISRETLESIPDILNTYYSIDEEIPQLQFSYLFDKFKIPFTDFCDKYACLFWNSEHKIMVKFNDLKNILMIPIQMYKEN